MSYRGGTRTSHEQTNDGAGQILNVLAVWTIFNVLHVLYNFSDMTMYM